MPPENFAKINFGIAYFWHFRKMKWSFLQWRYGTGRIRIKICYYHNHWQQRTTELTPYISQPYTAHPMFIEHLSKAEVHFLVLRGLNLYSSKCAIA